MSSKKSTDYDKSIEDLRKQVGNIISSEKKRFEIDLKFNTSKMYLAIPVVMSVLLLIMSPSFIKNEYIENEIVVNKISYVKLFMFSLVFSAVVIIGLFGYSYKKRNK